MSTFTKLSYHLVFSTKQRQPIIKEEFQTRLYAYLGGIIAAKKGHLIEVGGIEDHIHILANLSPTQSISEKLREIKANTSKWSNENFQQPRFEWQKGYGAFTVSYSQIESVTRYIQNQKEHHKTKTFVDEYVGFLKLHNIKFDSQYLFEAEYYG